MVDHSQHKLVGGCPHEHQKIACEGHEMDMVFTSAWFRLWLQPWNVDSEWKLAVTCVALAIFAALNEALRAGKSWLVTERGTRTWRSRNHWIQVCLHFIQTMAGFLLMLATMTFNPWVLLAVCLGTALGYAVFAPFTRQSEPGAQGHDGGNGRGEVSKRPEEGTGSYRRLSDEDG